MTTNTITLRSLANRILMADSEREVHFYGDGAVFKSGPADPTKYTRYTFDQACLAAQEAGAQAQAKWAKEPHDTAYMRVFMLLPVEATDDVRRNAGRTAYWCAVAALIVEIFDAARDNRVWAEGRVKSNPWMDFTLGWRADSCPPPSRPYSVIYPLRHLYRPFIDRAVCYMSISISSPSYCHR